MPSLRDKIHNQRAAEGKEGGQKKMSQALGRICDSVAAINSHPSIGTQRPDISFTEKGVIVHGKNGESPTVYVPNPTGTQFADSNCFFNLVMGPYGSGKSTICVHRIVAHA